MPPQQVPGPKKNQPADHGTTPNRGPATQKNPGLPIRPLILTGYIIPLVDFFGFFGAQKREFFGVHPKKVLFARKADEIKSAPSLISDAQRSAEFFGVHPKKVTAPGGGAKKRPDTDRKKSRTTNFQHPVKIDRIPDRESDLPR